MLMPSHEENHCGNVEMGDGEQEEIRIENLHARKPRRGYLCINRTSDCTKVPSTLGKRRRDAFTALIDGKLSAVKCCKRKMCFLEADEPFLRRRMEEVSEMSSNERRRALRDMLRFTNTSNGLKPMFYYDGRSVCAAFLEKAFRFSRDLQSSVKCTPGYILKCNERILSSNLDTPAPGRNSIVSFLERIADSTAGKMPDRDEQHLPFFKKQEVYERFKYEFTLLHSTVPPSSSYFFHTWKQYCPSIKVRKVSRFAKCDVCEEIRVAILQASRPGCSTEFILERRKIHVDMVFRERLEYQKKSERAVLHPDRYCSICVDGADQSAFGLPHFATSTKNMRGRALRVRLIGILEHGSEKKLHLFTMTEEFQTGANHIIECVHRFIQERVRSGPLPPTLYVQLDNCSRENKNRYFFAFLECLVAWKVFEEVHASFLPVGHTHSDIDQSFSCTSRRLRTNDAITLSDLHTQLRQAYTPAPLVGHVKHVANFSGLCKEGKNLTKVKRFSDYQYFKFNRRDLPSIETGDCNHSHETICYVKNSCSEEWKVLNGGNQCMDTFIRNVPDLRNTPPNSIKCPDGAREVELRFRSEEGRINSSSKMATLRDTASGVFLTREEKFHWDLSSIIEMKTILSPKAGFSTEEAELSELEEESKYQNLQNKHGYQPNYFVAVRPEVSTPSCPFWIAKINKVVKTRDGNACSLDVHWYEPSSEGNVYRCRYSPSYLFNNTSDPSHGTPWKNTLSTDSVLVEFDSLTKKGNLRMNVVKLLRSEFPH